MKSVSKLYIIAARNNKQTKHLKYPIKSKLNLQFKDFQYIW